MRSKFALPSPREHPGGGLLSREIALPTPHSLSAGLPAEVSVALLIPQQIMAVAGWTDTYLCAIYAGALNRYCLDHWVPADQRFRLAIAISPHEPELAVQEIGRHAANPAVAAITMPLLATHLGQSHYRPILTEAARHRLPLIIHPSGREGSIVGAPALGGIGPRHTGEYYALIWQVAAVNIASLVYDGVFSLLPDLRVVFAGCGFEWLPQFLWHADMEWRNLRIDIPWVVDRPSQIMARHIRLVVDDLGATPVDAAQQLAELIPDDMLMFGSDTPFATSTGAHLLQAVAARLLEKFAGGNAASCLRLPVPA